MYDGQEGIYFAVQYGPEWGNEKTWANQPITEIKFINIAGQVDTVQLKVMTTGRIKDYDRSFSVAIVPDTTTAVEGLNYEPLEKEYTVKAGEFFTYVPVVLRRTENIQKIKKDIVLQLIPNEQFTIGIPQWKRLPGQWESTVLKGDFKADFHKLEISDFVSRPSQWIGLENNGLEAGWWGVFTEKKYRLICEHFNLVYEDFMTAAKMPQAKKDNIREYMVRFLQNLYNAGTPILEEDGRLMWFSGVSWTSRVGVPWGGK